MDYTYVKKPYAGAACRSFVNIQTVKGDVIMKKESIQPFVTGLAIGAIGLLVVIFWAGWVVTSGSARAEGERMSKQAVLDNLSPICVAQFQKDPDMATKLEQLKKKYAWERGDYVKKEGWSTLPGDEPTVPGLAEECAEKIIQLSAK